MSVYALTPIPSSLAPLRLDCPSVQFSQGHEGDNQRPIGEVGVVLGAYRVVLENEGNDVRVNDDAAHAAGSSFLWPRHSWRAAKKSSMRSSSGQKSPCVGDGTLPLLGD